MKDKKKNNALPGRSSSCGGLGGLMKEFITKHPNGQIKQKGQYLNGKKHGLWVSYDEDTQDVIENYLSTGLGFKEFGKIREETNYQNGVKHGPSKRWYENGDLMDQGNYILGEKDGEWKENYKFLGSIRNHTRFYNRFSEGTIDKSFLYDRKLDSYWSHLSDDAMSFEDALKYAEEFGEGWRLPRKEEMGKIHCGWVGEEAQQKYIDPELHGYTFPEFTDAGKKRVWSYDPSMRGYPSETWVFRFEDGKIDRDSTRSEKEKWPNDWIPKRYVRLIKKA